MSDLATLAGAGAVVVVIDLIIRLVALVVIPRDRLPTAAAVDALEAAFASTDPSGGPLRTHLETPNGSLLLMPAADERLGVGVKLVALTPGNPSRALPFIHASYVLFDAETQAPEAMLDGSALTAHRTAAVSALATRHLARPDASW